MPSPTTAPSATEEPAETEASKPVLGGNSNSVQKPDAPSVVGSDEPVNDNGDNSDNGDNTASDSDASAPQNDKDADTTGTETDPAGTGDDTETVADGSSPLDGIASPDRTDSNSAGSKGEASKDAPLTVIPPSNDGADKADGPESADEATESSSLTVVPTVTTESQADANTLAQTGAAQVLVMLGIVISLGVLGATLVVARRRTT